MKTNLYIPKTITIGFQNRSDTFTGKLGYVIYTDHKGVLRKEASWNSWRDKKITAVTVDNTPQQGFTLNKGIQRDGYWGSGRSVIRVWDPRDFEFEISVDNLIGILMHADVCKRDITESCVFAWNGTELVLLPTNSVEYQESVAHTEKQVKKFSAKELTPGYTYSVRKENQSVVYLGLFERYELNNIYENEQYGYSRGVEQKKKPKKGHAFIDPTSKEVMIKDPSAFISNVEVEEVHQDFASLMDAYYSHAESQPFVGAKVGEPETSGRTVWAKLNETDFVEFAHDLYAYTYTDSAMKPFAFAKFARVDANAKVVHLTHEGYTSWHTRYNNRTVPARTIAGLDCSMEQVVVILEQINEVLARINREDPIANNSYDYKHRRIRNEVLMKALYKELGVGDLQLVLADGKAAIDHHIC